MARYIFRGGRVAMIDSKAHRDLVDLTPAELIQHALDMAEGDRLGGFDEQAATFIELAYRLEGLSFPNDDPEVDEGVDRLPVLVCGPHTDGNVVAVPVTPETTLVDLMAALEQSVKDAKESRKRHKARTEVTEPGDTEPVFVDVWPIEYDDEREHDF